MDTISIETMNCLATRGKKPAKKPAWQDPRDPIRAVDQFMEEKETDIEEEGANDERDRSDHSDSDSDHNDDGDCDMFAGDVRSKKVSLEAHQLKFKHLVNINNERSYKGAVRQVQFNPKSKMALVTLKSGQADLFEVDGERNRYLQNIKVPKTAKAFCSFKPDGNNILISSETYQGNFYNYNMTTSIINSYHLRVSRDRKTITDFALSDDLMACRKEGSSEILILSAKTYEIISTFKLNENAKAIQFGDDNQLFIAGENAQLYLYDVRKSSTCKHKFIDEGNVHISSFHVSMHTGQIAVGSSCGIVNSYNLNDCLSNRSPKPQKTFSNLKASCDILKYNSTGELLFMSSNAKPNTMRMVHSLSDTVYRNFPIAGKKYDYILSADFSPLSGYLALGCSNGRAQLCRLSYYKSY